jgi:hypothetical protein
MIYRAAVSGDFNARVEQIRGASYMQQSDYITNWPGVFKGANIVDFNKSKKSN